MDYTGAQVKVIAHPNLQPGDLCPFECGGRVYLIRKPSSVIRLYAGSLAQAVRYELERLRCNLCLEIFTAPLPKTAGKEKYTNSFKATLAVNHYVLGMPFYRLARYHHYMGIPLAASNQFACMEILLGVVLPVYHHLLFISANGKHLHTDDTPMRIASLQQENKKLSEDARRGIFTTGIIATVDSYDIYLVFTGRNHAGENLGGLLKARQTDLEKLLVMCDALSRNMPKEASLKTLLIMCYCLVHARRNFFECRDEYPEFCDEVLDYFAGIYKNEAHCKANRLLPKQRLQYHRQHSRPLMKQVYRLCLKHQQEKTIEPNSSLGKAILYLIKYRRQLTRFLRIEDARLDNNYCERLLKKIICYRKNSLSYKTQYGAFVGDVLMSLIITAMNAKVNPILYLTALQDNAEVVRKASHLWLPWNYEQNLQPITLLDTG